MLGRSSEEDSLRQIKYHAVPGVFKPHDLLRIAWNLPNNEYPVGSLLLQRTAFDYSAEHRRPLNEISIVSQIIADNAEASFALLDYPHVERAKRWNLTRTYGVKLLVRIQLWLINLPPHDQVNKALAQCFIVLTNIHLSLSSPDEAIGYGDKNIDTIRRRYGGKSNEHKQYGIQLYYIGRAHEIKGDQGTAALYFDNAYRAFDKAKDHCDEIEKSSWLKKLDTARKRFNSI